MPTVLPKETRSRYVSRCVPIVLKEVGTKSTAHAVAKCGGMWDQARKKRLTVNRTRVVASNPLKADPTRTRTLRRIFETEFRRRFNRLKAKIIRLVDQEDAFGLRQTQNEEQSNEERSEHFTNSRRDTDSDLLSSARPMVHPVTINEEQSDGRNDEKRTEKPREYRSVITSTNRDTSCLNVSEGTRKIASSTSKQVLINQRWAFRSDPNKVKAFNKWLQTQIQADIITTTAAKAEDAYWKRYVEEGYRKGAGRAFDDTRAPVKAAMDAASAEQLAFYEGTRAEFLRSSFARPVAIDKVKLLAGRVFTDLNGVTTAMSTQITRALTDGLVQGMNPREIARRMVGPGSLLESIGKRRAELIARTEIIRAHAEGQLDAMERLGVTEVGVMVEWSTAGDDRVCELCSALDGVVLSIKEARGIIPRHPQCRCAHIPANVGESTKGQIRGKGKVESAFDKSVKAEAPKRSLAKQKQRTKWAGVDKTIAKARPKPIVKKRVPIERLKFQEVLETIGEKGKNFGEILELLGPEYRGLGSTKVLSQIERLLKQGKIIRQGSKFRIAKVLAKPKAALVKPKVSKPKLAKAVPKKKPVPELAESASKWLEERVHYGKMSRKDAKEFQDLSEAVMDRVGQSNRKRIGNIEIHFHDSQQSIDEVLLREFGQEPDVMFSTKGFFDYEDQRLHSGYSLAKQLRTSERIKLERARTFSHEVGHAIDHSGELKRQFSSKAAWRRAWKEELSYEGNLSISDYAGTHAREGFAEFSRAMFGPDQSLKNEVMRKCPKCTAFWRKEGLL